MDSRWVRLARGLSAAVFAITIAGVSHSLAGGTAPTLFAILVSLVIAGAICTVLTGVSPSFWRLASSVALSQFLFHAVFGGLGTPTTAMHTMGSSIPDAAATHPHAGPTMWVAHVAAGVITLVALRYAETAFWGVADTARLLIARLLPVMVPAIGIPAGRIPVRQSDAMSPLAHIQLSMRRRGPPMGLSAA